VIDVARHQEGMSSRIRITTAAHPDLHLRVRGLAPATFAPWFALSDEELAARRAARVIADQPHAFPCRVSLADAAPGEELLLLPYAHLPVESPYRGEGPIYVRRAAQAAFDAVDVIPDALARRLLSVRAYDQRGWMVDADVAPGSELAALAARLLARAEVAYLHVHHARHGCFACRIDRT
jgi:hypothetical protein